MAIEKDAASDGKKTTMVIVGAVVIVSAGAYLGWGYLNRPEPTPSQYNLNRVANNAPRNSAETVQYQRLQSEANSIGYKTADNGGTSFVASLRMSDINAEMPAPAPQPVNLNTTPADTQQGSNPQNGGIAEDQKAALKGYLKTLNDRWKPGNMQLASAFGQGAQSQQGTNQPADTSAGGSFGNWTQSLPGNAPTVTPASLEAQTKARTDIVVVPPNTRRPGVIDSAVDSDNLNSIVLAHIPAGVLAGASFTAQGVQLAGDGVVIHFTRMTLNSVDYQVDAYALQDDTLQSAVASDVSNRYISRILLPAVASSLGGLGDLYKQQNTQILSTNAGTISGGTGKVSGSAVAGTIVGGLGANAGKVMTNDASRLPVKQVKVFKNQIVAIQFMKGVYESDRVNKSAAVTPLNAGEQ